MISEEISYSVQIEDLENERYSAGFYKASYDCDFCDNAVTNDFLFEGHSTYRNMCMDCARKVGIPDDIINVLERLAKEEME